MISTPTPLQTEATYRVLGKLLTLLKTEKCLALQTQHPALSRRSRWLDLAQLWTVRARLLWFLGCYEDAREAYGNAHGFQMEADTLAVKREF